MIKGNKKIMNAWAFYDWSNSVYSLVISSSIFPLYYGIMFPKDDSYTYFLGFEIKATALMSFVTAFAFLVIAIISPILSGISDFLGNKKSFMRFFCFLGGGACIGMYWFTKETMYWGVLCFFLGLIGFWGSMVFYNSYLPDIAMKEQQDGLSAKGFSLGYIGSVLLLLICLFLILSQDNDEDSFHMMRISFVLTGVWWLLFSQYSFYYLPSGYKKEGRLNKNVFLNGIRELIKVKNELFQQVVLRNYLRAFFVYSMAVQTVMLVATYFGEQEINWGSPEVKTKGLIISILIIQIIAIGGAYVTSFLSQRLGNIQTLSIINVLWAVICVMAYFISEPIEFYFTAFCVGLVMGGIQSLSRSTYSKLLPASEDTTSFFSFYDVTEKIGIIIGMSLYGLIDHFTGSMRNSIIFLTLFFIVGWWLLGRVPKEKAETV